MSMKTTIAMALISISVAANACTVCESGTGVAVRQGISEEFWSNLGMVMAPFIGTFLILAVAHFVLPIVFGPSTDTVETNQR
jgi:hypothetical protein